MKRMWIAAMLLGAMSMGARGQSVTDGEQSPEVQRLRERVAQLEKEVARLKKELAARPFLSIAPQPEYAVPYRSTVRPAPSEPVLPPGSEKREFNGTPYYVVPLTLNAVPPAMEWPKQPVTVEYHVIDVGRTPETITAQSLRKQQRPAEIVPPELLNPSK